MQGLWAGYFTVPFPVLIVPMSGAAFALVVNMLLAVLVAATFLVLARTAASPGVRWFGLSYAIGAGTPLSELLVRLSPVPEPFIFLSFATFSLAFHVMAAGLSRYYHVPLARWFLPASFAASLGVRLLMWRAPRGVFVYEFAYQLAFTFALMICTTILLIGAPRRWLDRLLTFTFALTAMHFLVKPFLSVIVGAGPTARDYIDSRYALISQSVTAVALIATALSLVLVVVRNILEAAGRQADIDELSGLANRRAFDRDASAVLARLGQGEPPCAALMFDLDHFKSINDSHGHAAGDDVIQAFAKVLREIMPRDAIIGRMGGEEFAVLLQGSDDLVAKTMVQRVRSHFGAMSFTGSDGPFRASASCGLAVPEPGETLHSLMIRCDRALYRAKAEGRDRLVVAR
ncbi:hypothetical protein C3941_21035 [Kaistia algarum]|nr:hypothetical protein C3941_21035 [Kaistia algarum]